MRESESKIMIFVLVFYLEVMLWIWMITLTGECGLPINSYLT